MHARVQKFDTDSDYTGWGRNRSGQLGLGHMRDMWAPQQVLCEWIPRQFGGFDDYMNMEI